MIIKSLVPLINKEKFFMSEENTGKKSGFIGIVGRPNVGKSTLLNTILNQKIAAVSARPQTTRRRQLGILTLNDAQMVFMDTPGYHTPHNKLGEFMNGEAEIILDDVDVLIWVVDASVSPDKEDILLAKKMAATKGLPPVILALNKMDETDKNLMGKHQEEYLALLPQCEPVQISAHFGNGVGELSEKLIEKLPLGPFYYEEEQVTDFYERDIAVDLIREAALTHLRDEVPHEIAVRIDEYKERGEDGALIEATLFVSRESHKGIVIGRKGAMLKHIGITARMAIEEMSGRKVFLKIRVKVDKNWKDNPDALQRFGYTPRK